MYYNIIASILRSRNTKIWDSGWFREIKIERSETVTSHRSIALPCVSPPEGIQSLGEGFCYYLGPNGDYYASRGVTTAKSVILGGLVTNISRSCEGKLKHRSIALPCVSPPEGIQSLGEGFCYYLGPNGDYYASRGVTTAKSGILGGLVTYISRSCEGKLKHRSIALPCVSPLEGIQSLGEGFCYYLGPNGDYYASRGAEK